MRDSESGGFTLLELLVVLAILSSMIALAVPFGVRSVQAAQQRSRVRAVIAELHNLQSLAVTRHREIVVRRFTTENTRALFVEDQRALKSKAIFTGTDGTITYYADGSSSGGTVSVGAVQIKVAWLSGHITTRSLQ